ncbi:MAG: NAD(P)H-hydrate dehydratase [Rhodocyclaceae bacterium]|nr:NAD(P)H-hydrate dehydratase [Rhodocyclaceae bacterium]MDZ4216409.1 NAD(P)H-hydrate dehydratase [Rhodocyclaceae bacterium]
MRRPILNNISLRAIESREANASPPLMERAGASATQIALEMLADTSRAILVVAGPGNNGGDGFVMARLLKQAGRNVTVAFCGDQDKLPPDARQAHDAWQATSGCTLSSFPDGDFGLIIDALFGIGLARPIEGMARDWIERINTAHCPVLSLDIPSGLNADTGIAAGPVVQADCTASFIALKPGILTADGPDMCGKLIHCSLDIAITRVDGEEISPAHFHRHLKPRRRNSHKGSFGNVAIIGGASGMAGAALLCGRAALKLGAGRVYVGMLDALAVDPVQPELMLRSAQDVAALADVIAIGPGLGQSLQAGELLSQSLECDKPLILDADALNLLTQGTVLLRKVAVRSAPTFLTPHPTEAARLLDIRTEQVQADRLTSAKALAQRFRAHVVLKGCGSIVVCPDGRWFINTTGNPGLASAGTGDVLTGVLAALLAQGWEASAALLAAVHLHGAAADYCVAQEIGPIGLTASELINSARQILNDWIAKA